MKSKFYACTIILFSILLSACESVSFKEDEKVGIQFKRDHFQEAYVLAARENKIIFLDFYAEWCGFCKKMKQYTFSDKYVGEYFNERFINYSIDAEKGEGPALAAKYGITGFPAYVFLDATGKVIAQQSGFMEAPEFITLASGLKKK
ncbi:MAG: thioredoxin family protein [Chitinophagaceae bacterium]|nr:thioredoxin family protein [Chitinophagaceae bacterium]